MEGRAAWLETNANVVAPGMALSVLAWLMSGWSIVTSIALLALPLARLVPWRAVQL
jgi:hypothetical protein